MATKCQSLMAPDLTDMVWVGTDWSWTIQDIPSSGYDPFAAHEPAEVATGIVSSLWTNYYCTCNGNCSGGHLRYGI
jgi:hypothetical protein